MLSILGDNSRGTIVRRQRDVAVDVRFARVQLKRPWNHPHPAAGRSVWAVYLSEPAAVDAEHAADAEHAVDWVVLTSEPVECFGDALRLTGYYTRCWVIEEWHRALKEGCRLEASQLDDPEDHLRLTALLSIMAVRLLQLRDLAKVDHPDADDPAALRRRAPAVGSPSRAPGGHAPKPTDAPAILPHNRQARGLSQPPPRPTARMESPLARLV